jgi:glucose-6-phosphate isomerase
VELGKQMALDLTPALTSAEPGTPVPDPSTGVLVERYRRLRGRAV